MTCSKKKKMLETKSQDEILKYLLASLKMYNRLAHTQTHTNMYRATFPRKFIKDKIKV